MPFTAAHPAIVLPFLNVRYFSATALVIGSISPDFEYFFQMAVNSRHSHALTGVLYFDLPVTFFLGWIFHHVVKKNFIGNLPLFFQRRLQELLHLKTSSVIFKRPILFAFSAIIGAASHIFWDGFTHTDTYFTNTLPFYHGAFFPFNGVRYPLYYALQHISTYIGLIFITFYLIRLKPSTNATIQRPQLWYWVMLLTITAVAVCLRFAVRNSDLEIGNFVVTVISGLCLAVTICGLIKIKASAVPDIPKHG
ncbi:MAG: DUF4184 family protein [Chryseolinea sp.]